MTDGNEGVPDTLFIPLAARIYSTERFPEYFKDEASLRFRDKVPESIVSGSSEYSMVASVARYRNTDAMIRDFVERNGRSNIVFLGAGLDTACIRLSDLDACFYEMDLPEVIEMRGDLIPVAENEVLIPGDLFDMRWAEKVDRTRQTMILALGVFQYFPEKRIIDAIGRMKELFPGAELVFDATDSKGLKYAERHVRRTGNQSAAMYFAVDDSEQFALRTGTELMEYRPFFTDARRMLNGKVGIYTRIAMNVADNNGRAKILRMGL